MGAGDGFAYRWGYNEAPDDISIRLDLNQYGIEPEPWQEQWTTLMSKVAGAAADKRESQMVWAIVAYLLDESMDHFETTLVIPREKLLEILSRPGVPEIIEFGGEGNPDDCVGIRVHRRGLDEPDRDMG